MNYLHIKRVSTGKNGTFGVMIHNDIPFALTLERQWLNNAVGESCIPQGVYMCNRVMSPRFGDTFQVMDVYGRSHILFHKGNLNDDSHGCILVGEKFGNLGSKPGILESGAGFGEFMNLMSAEQEFSLTITDFFN